MRRVIRVPMLVMVAAGSGLWIAACGGQGTGGSAAALSHSQVVKAAAHDCEATAKSLARGSGGATPARYKSTVDHLGAELTGLAARDGNPREAAALRQEVADLGRYAADIGALPRSEYLHSTTYLLRQPIKGDMDLAIKDSLALKQRYGIVCIPG